MYFRVKQRLEEQEIYFSESKILRFLAAKEFDEEVAYDMLVDNHDFYIRNNVEVLDESEFQYLIDNQTIVHHKSDINGRPVVYLRLRLAKPDETNDRDLMMWMIWIMRQIKDAMPKHVDSYLLIYDLRDSGWGNVSLNQMTGAMKKTGAQYPESIHRILVINPTW